MSNARKKRVPFGVPKLQLSVDDTTRKKLISEKKEARWFKDDVNRIQRALEGGWDFVKHAKVGDAEEEKVVHTGKGGTVMYLMAIPKRFYDEDQEAKEEKNKMVDDAIRGGQSANPHGVESTHGSSYVKGVDYKP